MLPTWMIKRMNMTPGKPHKQVKRRGKWYILSLSWDQFYDLATHSHVGSNLPLKATVEEWLNERIGPIDDGCWDWKNSKWYVGDLEYDQEFLDIYFPDLESLTMFKIAWFGDELFC